MEPLVRVVVPRDAELVVRAVVERDTVERVSVAVPREVSFVSLVALERDTVVRDVARADVSLSVVLLVKLLGIVRDATTPSAANAVPTNSAISKNNGLYILIITIYYIIIRASV